MDTTKNMRLKKLPNKINKPLLFVFLFLAWSMISCFKGQEADLIIHNAQIHSLDGSYTEYEAMAIKDGKIIDLGPEREILNKFSGESIDMKQRHIYPGLVDGHGHFLGAAKAELMAQLYDARNKQDIISILKKYPKETSNGWILGRGWNQEKYPNKEMLTLQELDQIFPNNPVALTRIDGHAMVVNSKALELCNIDTNYVIYGGTITGKGMMLDNAMKVIHDQIPEYEDQLLIPKVIALQNQLFSYGITAVHDPGISIKDLELYQKLEANKDLKIFVYAMFHHNKEEMQYLVTNGKVETNRISVTSIKAYADGALGSRGACLKSPYIDAPTNGLMLIEENKLNELATFCINNDVQLNTHCIGDSAFNWVLNIYGKHLNPGNDRRWRIEHAQVVDPKDLETMKKYNVIPSVQPCHALSDAKMVVERIGNRSVHAYNYRALKNHAGIIISGTDFPVEFPDPFRNFMTGTERQELDMTPDIPFQKSGALTKKEMIKSMTTWAHHGSFTENINGSLEKGKNADFIVLNQDLLEVSKDKIRLTYVISTFINGKEVYSAE